MKLETNGGTMSDDETPDEPKPPMREKILLSVFSAVNYKPHKALIVVFLVVVFALGLGLDVLATWVKIWVIGLFA